MLKVFSRKSLPGVFDQRGKQIAAVREVGALLIAAVVYWADDPHFIVLGVQRDIAANLGLVAAPTTIGGFPRAADLKSRFDTSALCVRIKHYIRKYGRQSFLSISALTYLTNSSDKYAAGIAAKASQRDKVERLARYVSWPPIATEQGGLFLLSFRFRPGPTDCVADIRPLIRTIRWPMTLKGTLDPLIEGFLDYKRDVNKVAHGTVKDGAVHY